MLILGIESSCDETAISLVEITKKKLIVQENLVSSQVKLHAKYGGVVPEVAARKHTEVIIPLLEEALGKNYDQQDIDLIAVTSGPGLITSLLVGLETAKTIAYCWRKPIVGVNHLSGHLYSSWLASEELTVEQNDLWPAIALLVSGGHTELLSVQGYENYKIIGRTRDDAVGEAFDKVAKILDLGCPGGPAVAKRAADGDPRAIEFPRPMLREKSFDFSFSGLKTAVRYYVRDHKMNEQLINDICASFQQAVTEVLVSKTLSAVVKYQAKSVIIGGGVAANKQLRKDLLVACDKAGLPFYCPRLTYTGDNAAMIALAGYYQTKDLSLLEFNRLVNNWKKLIPDPNWQL
ncbi:MAG: tRNA (adenosine(37)-N6)-threonylcarbamoyltransferase complex transferase subunit TsaD [Candidatus Komeilibacteria bacterium CG_4_10_14_0_2_um_filter_37_10]|uniref:tRNA N6-adenosine threonylcarbamoyltransferase n=1 Tax=Candidatus Komeilibacteria bacterium CG_4_10_14_0_2_um_filter_37_10 TaxID=1974470 RepID=A0A2M7VF77_9BACT|nr:MAG: tRNA (adenosine(37)-N6)-threonylcarbamoyltransferase complex transferase subunit TsaD [Candidatus Komeilibacteria bacterium CG_4_10_14_0_2_um_filter_37_10]